LPIKVWVDADALPNDVKEIILRAAERLRVETVLVANKNVWIGEGVYVSFVRVGEGADIADAYIVESSAAGDLCVTADVPLASRLVRRGLTVIDPRGELYSEESIGERLAMRDLMHDLRASGMQTGGPAPWGPRAKQRFASLFDRELTRALREQGS
jgi:uncharacterized protein YaiI (UPF0178 family)